MKTRAPAQTSQQQPAPAKAKTPERMSEPEPVPATFDLSKVPIHRPDAGEPLPSSVRARFEPRFGTDLSSVRVHRDPEAARWVSQLGANAATVRNHIAFAPGKYAPSTPSGERMLAHELAHVVQHDRHDSTPGTMSAPGDAAEVEATSAADRVVAGLPAGQLRAPVAAIARDTELIEFEVDPTNPNMLVHEPSPESQPEWIDNSLEQCGYSLWLFGFAVWVKGHADPIHIPSEHINFTAQEAIPINHHIYNSYAEASAAVAKEPRRFFDFKPRYAYYWGAGGQVIVPTLICPATAPRTTETMWQTRLKYVDYVERGLMMVAAMLIFSRVLGWLHWRFGRFEPEPPPAPPYKPPTAPKLPEQPKVPEPIKPTETTAAPEGAPQSVAKTPTKQAPTQEATAPESTTVGPVRQIDSRTAAQAKTDPQQIRRYNRYTKTSKSKLDFDDWWNTYGRRPPPNPAGKTGNPAHVSTIQDKLVGQARQEFPNDKIVEGQSIEGFKAPNGKTIRMEREPDVSVIDAKDGVTVKKVYEAARTNKDGSFVAREVAKKKQYDGLGLPSHFEPVIEKK